MSIPKLSPLNDLAFVATIKVADSAGKLVPLTEATTKTAFLATSDAPTAEAADNTLAMVPTYTGANGKWLVAFDASVLTAALLDAKFADTAPYCIVQFDGSIRVAFELEYEATKLVEVS